MNDSELRNAFHQLRDAETAHVPQFRVPNPARSWRPALAVALLLVIIVAVVSFLPIRRRAPQAESIVTWKAPTDVLLRTPGSELLSTVPRIPELPERK
jgi:hypothetical protein